MGVIVRMRTRCGRIDLMTALRGPRYSLAVVREDHLHRASDSHLRRRRPELRLCPEIYEATVTFGKPRAYDYRLEKMERRAIGRCAPQDLTQKFLGGPFRHILCQSLHMGDLSKATVRDRCASAREANSARMERSHDAS